MKGVSSTGTWILGASSMVVASATGLANGQVIQATGIPVGAVITGIAGTTVSWSVSLPATQPGTAAIVAFVTLMKVSDLYSGITDLLMGRVVQNAKMAEAIRKAVLEFTEDYKFTELQETGPVIAFIPGQAAYVPNYFLNPGDAILKLNKVNSFFLYTDSFVSPASQQYNGNNAGYDITFRTIDRMEVLINTSGLPLHWTRHDGYLWFGCNPDQAYNGYMRYQREHPFPNAGAAGAGDDPLYLPDSWQEALEYAAAARLSQTYNLSTKTSELTSRLKGDEKFQRSGGIEGSPGLIFHLTSDQLRDQSTTVKQFRLRMGRR